MSNINERNETTAEKASHVVKGEDKPIGSEHPAAPAALVIGVYPIVLLVAICLIALYFSMTAVAPTETGGPPPTNSTGSAQ